MKNFNILNLSDYQEVFLCLEDALKDKNMIIFKGELGVGKTTFIKEFLKYKYSLTDQTLSKEGMASPTFTIENQYMINGDLIIHFDFYRMNENEYDLEEHIEDFKEAKIVFIEWPEKINLKKTLSPSDFIEVSIELVKDQDRIVTVSRINPLVSTHKEVTKS